MIERGTVYWGGAFAGKKREARGITIRLDRYAQYEAAIFVDCILKRGRNPSQLRLTEGWMVILEGWEHPNPPGTYGAGVPLKGDPTTTVHATSYPIGDPRWLSEFSVFLEGYIARTGAVMAADFRAHDFKPKVYSRKG